MHRARFAAELRPKAVILLALISFCGTSLGQEVAFSLLRPGALQPVPMVRSVQPETFTEAPIHHFWDRENGILFATSGAFSTADFILTRNNLRNHGQELNPVTHLFAGSTAGLALNFGGETAGVVGLSYLFHKTGHHKLERIVSLVNIGSSAAAISFNVNHR